MILDNTGTTLHPPTYFWNKHAVYISIEKVSIHLRILLHRWKSQENIDAEKYGILIEGFEHENIRMLVRYTAEQFYPRDNATQFTNTFTLQVLRTMNLVVKHCYCLIGCARKLERRIDFITTRARCNYYFFFLISDLVSFYASSRSILLLPPSAS